MSDKKQDIVIWTAWLQKEGMTVRDFADALAMDYNTVYRWFHTGVHPNHTMRRLIARKFPKCPLVAHQPNAVA
jgi:transposase-like protein